MLCSTQGSALSLCSTQSRAAALAEGACSPKLAVISTSHGLLASAVSSTARIHCPGHTAPPRRSSRAAEQGVTCDNQLNTETPPYPGATLFPIASNGTVVCRKSLSADTFLTAPPVPGFIFFIPCAVARGYFARVLHCTPCRLCMAAALDPTPSSCFPYSSLHLFPAPQGILINHIWCKGHFLTRLPTATHCVMRH